MNIEELKPLLKQIRDLQDLVEDRAYELLKTRYNEKNLAPSRVDFSEKEILVYFEDVYRHINDEVYIHVPLNIICMNEDEFNAHVKRLKSIQEKNEREYKENIEKNERLEKEAQYKRLQKELGYE